MPGFEYSLQAGETTALQARQHPIVYLRAAVWAIVAILLAGCAALAREPRFWGLAAVLFAAAAAVAALETGIRRKTTELSITDRRVMLRSGVFERRLVEAFPTALAGFELSQGPFGRLLGYGWLRIRGLEPAAWLALAEPERIRSAIEALALRHALAMENLRQPEPARPSEPAKMHLGPLENADLVPPRKTNGAARPKPDGRAHGLRPLAEVDRF